MNKHITKNILHIHSIGYTYYLHDCLMSLNRHHNIIPYNLFHINNYTDAFNVKESLETFNYDIIVFDVGDGYTDYLKIVIDHVIKNKIPLYLKVHYMMGDEYLKKHNIYSEELKSLIIFI